MGKGIFGNSEDLEILDDEPSPDNSDQEPGQGGDDSLGAGPDEGEPEKGQEQREQDELQGQTAQAPAGEATADGLILGKFKNQEQLATSYQQLEQRHGHLSQENAILRNLVQQLYFGSLAGGMQSGYAPMGAPGFAPMGVPQFGAMAAPAQGAQAEQPPQPTVTEDPNKWLEEFYEKGPAAIDARIEARARKIAEEMIQQAATQYLAPIGQSINQIQQFVHQEAMRRYYTGLVRQAATQYEDFASLRGDVEALLQENPHWIYLPFQTGQNPYEVAYQEAKRRREAAQQQERQTSAQKKGAQMPRPTAATRREPQPQDEEKAYIRALYGLDRSDSAKGIYGQIE